MKDDKKQQKESKQHDESPATAKEHGPHDGLDAIGGQAALQQDFASYKQAAEQREKELVQTLQRLQAEFENFRKRNEAQNKQMIQLAAKGIILKLLPVLDNIELSLKNKDNPEQFAKGVEMIHSQLHKMLGEEGLAAVPSVNEKFSHLHHEPLLEEETEHPERIVLEEFQKGYKLHDQVIRHAKVKVSKPKSKETTKKETNN